MDLESQARKSKPGKGIVITGALIIIVIVVAYFAFFYPSPAKEQTRGTLANVEKAERYQDKQLSQEEILQQNPEIARLVQSAAWQNAMKNPELVALLQTDNFEVFLKSSEYKEWAKKAIACKLLNDDNLKTLLGNELFAACVFDSELRKVADDKFIALLFSDSFKLFLSHPAIQKDLGLFNTDPNALKRIQEKSIRVLGMDISLIIKLESFQNAFVGKNWDNLKDAKFLKLDDVVKGGLVGLIPPASVNDVRVRNSAMKFIAVCCKANLVEVVVLNQDFLLGIEKAAAISVLDEVVVEAL